MMSVAFFHCYAECHYAECHYTECQVPNIQHELQFYQQLQYKL
jgi:hypothetical protein